MIDLHALSEAMSLPVVSALACLCVGWLWRIDRAVAIMQTRFDAMVEKLEEIEFRRGRRHLQSGD